MSESGPVRDKRQWIALAEKYGETLHRLHDSFAVGSPEREALELAARSLQYAIFHDDFLAALSNDELTALQREHLARLGLDDSTPAEA